MKPLHKLTTLCLCVICLALLAGCFSKVYTPLKRDTAKRLTMPSLMMERRVTTGPFSITMWERIHNREGAPATIYIDGDGEVWTGTERGYHDPTPVNPVAMHLATRDKSKNVIYLARPCHYSAMAGGGLCPPEHWKSHRFGNEVMTAMNSALNDIRSRYNITRFHLVGFDGGATIVSLLAADRDDIASIRTVAGRLDYDMTDRIRDESLMQTPHRDAADVAPLITHIPQHHFIGEWDSYVPAAIFDSYLGHAVDGRCIRATIVARAGHDSGWVDQWPELLQAPLNCQSTL